MIIWSWIASIFWSVAPLLGWSRISYEPTYTSCTVDLMHPDKAYVSYIISCFICCYLLPVGLMVFVRIKPDKNYEPVATDVNKSYQVSSHTQLNFSNQPKKFFYFKKKIVILFLLFIIAWSPYAIVYLWPVFGDPKLIPISLAAAAPVFAKLSVVLTPLVLWNEHDQLINENKSDD